MAVLFNALGAVPPFTIAPEALLPEGKVQPETVRVLVVLSFVGNVVILQREELPIVAVLEEVGIFVAPFLSKVTTKVLRPAIQRTERPSLLS